MPDTPEARAAQSFYYDASPDEKAATVKELEHVILRANAEHYLPLLKAACAACEGLQCDGCCILLEIERLEKVKEGGA